MPRPTVGLLCALMASACFFGATLQSAYKGHADDSDINAVLAAYPAVKGRPADACATCHRSGDVPDPAKPGTTRHESHCDFCHTVSLFGKKDVKATLNGYGADYLAAGRGLAAVKAVAAKDSDGDGASNEQEILAGTDPGDRASHPAATIAPSHTFTATELRTMAPIVSETVLINTTKNRSGDTYSAFRGSRIVDLLQAMGVPAAADGIDVISLDGFEKSFTMDELRTAWPVGAPVMGLGTKDLGACGWVNYSAPGLTAGVALPPAHVLLAFEENGKALEKAVVDAASGRINGHGPLRVITPQNPSSGPDLGQRADPSCNDKVPPERRFHEEYDHNGGRSPFAIIAVRVRPLPPGTRDVDWASIRDQLLAKDQIVFFGAVGSGSGASRR